MSHYLPGIHNHKPRNSRTLTCSKSPPLWDFSFPFVTTSPDSHRVTNILSIFVFFHPCWTFRGLNTCFHHIFKRIQKVPTGDKQSPAVVSSAGCHNSLSLLPVPVAPSFLFHLNFSSSCTSQPSPVFLSSFADQVHWVIYRLATGRWT